MIEFTVAGTRHKNSQRSTLAAERPRCHLSSYGKVQIWFWTGFDQTTLAMECFPVEGVRNLRRGMNQLFRDKGGWESTKPRR